MSALEIIDNPPLQVILQERDRIQLLVIKRNSSGEREIENSELFSDVSELRVSPLFSRDGSLMCSILEKKNCIVSDACTGNVKFEIKLRDIQKAEFSPRGTFLVTWSPPSNGNTGENLRIWNTVDGALVVAYSLKVFKPDIMQWTADEALCFRMVSNEIHIFRGNDMASGIIDKVYCKGISQFKVSDISMPSCFICVFNPSMGGNPARVSIFKLQLSKLVERQVGTSTSINAGFREGGAPEGLSESAVVGPISSRGIMSASEAKISWNASGSAVLVHSHSDVDSTNYVGSSGLYLLFSESDNSMKVEQAKDGPVYDAQWSPLGDKFAVCAGNMPSASTLYNAEGTPIYQYGAAHRNTIRWAPHGRFLCIAGFGNLAGEMDFYDVVFMKKLGSNTSHCAVTSVWSPDSRLFMTATLAPRMNVDNGFKIFTYRGVGPVTSLDVTRAYFADWRPTLPSVYPNRPPSPKSKSTSTAVLPDVHPIATTSTAGAYRPPGSRGAAASFTVKDSPSITVGKVKDSNAKAVYKPPTAIRSRFVPGMAPPPPGAHFGGNKQQKAGGGNSGGNHEKKSSVKKSDPVARETADAPSLPLSPPKELTAEEQKKEAAKKMKNLRKKLGGIRELKAKQDAGVSLDADQLRKLDSIEAVEKEIHSLEKILS